MNSFSVQNNFYIQTKETAVGIPMVPSFENLRIGNLEENIQTKSHFLGFAL